MLKSIVPNVQELTHIVLPLLNSLQNVSFKGVLLLGVPSGVPQLRQ